jgi:hypothetical protein
VVLGMSGSGRTDADVGRINLSSVETRTELRGKKRVSPLAQGADPFAWTHKVMKARATVYDQCLSMSDLSLERGREKPANDAQMPWEDAREFSRADSSIKSHCLDCCSSMSAARSETGQV